MTIDQLLYLLLGASIAFLSGLGLWLLKDRSMIFGNVIFWGEGFSDDFELPKQEGEIWGRKVSWHHTVLQVRAMGDRVKNTRIQFNGDDQNPQISISPKVPFSMGHERKGEVLIPLLPSGTYVLK